VPAFLPVSVLHAATVPSSDAAVMVEVDLANGRRLRMHVRPDTDFKRVSACSTPSRVDIHVDTATECSDFRRYRAVDARKSFDGLAAVVRDSLGGTQ